MNEVKCLTCGYKFKTDKDKRCPRCRSIVRCAQALCVQCRLPICKRKN